MRTSTRFAAIALDSDASVTEHDRPPTGTGVASPCRSVDSDRGLGPEPDLVEEDDRGGAELGGLGDSDSTGNADLRRGYPHPLAKVSTRAMRSMKAKRSSTTHSAVSRSLSGDTSPAC